MRKSVIFIVMLAAFFSYEKLPAQQYYQNPSCCNPCCWIREGSAAFSLGYRTDDFEWRFKDSGSDFFIEGGFVPAESVGSIHLLTGEDQAVARGLPGPCFFPMPEGFCDDCFYDQGYDHHKTFKQKWEHQRMVNLGFRGKVDTNCCVYGRLNVDYGWICEGEFRSRGGFCSGPDIFFEEGCNQGLTPPRRLHGKGHTWDVVGGIGHNFRFCCDQFQLAPVIGWSYHHQDLHTKKFKAQTACLFTEDFFEFGFGGEGIAVLDIYSDAKHSYDAHWNGPWIGVDANWQWCCNVNIYGTFEYHWARHRGDAKCQHFFGFLIGEVIDLVDEPEEAQAVEFAFDSDTKLHNHICARGIYLEGGINYDFCSCLFVGFDVKYYNWRKLNNGRVDLKNCIFVEAFDKNDESDILISEDHVFTRCERVSGIRWESLRFEIKLGAKF